MNRFEVFNEIISLIFAILLQGFTGEILDTESEISRGTFMSSLTFYNIGWYCIAVFFLYVFVHLSY